MKTRILVAQGPSQLIFGMVALAYDSHKNHIGETEDVLVLGDFHTSTETAARLHQACLNIAKAGAFSKIFFTRAVDETYYRDREKDPAGYCRAVGLLLGLDRADEVYVAHNMQILNESVLHLFPSARKICYGDGYGQIMIGASGIARPRLSDDFIPLGKIVCLAPVAYTTDEPFRKSPLEIIPVYFYLKVMFRIMVEVKELAIYCQALGRGSSPCPVLITLGNLTEAGITRNMEGELSFYKESLAAMTPGGGTIYIKPHPREQHGQSAILRERLNQMGRDARLVDGFGFYPVEMFALFLPVSLFIVLFSASHIGWRLLNPETDLMIGVPPETMARHIDRDKIDFSLFALRVKETLMATAGVFNPIAYRDPSANRKAPSSLPARVTAKAARGLRRVGTFFYRRPPDLTGADQLYPLPFAGIPGRARDCWKSVMHQRIGEYAKDFAPLLAEFTTCFPDEEKWQYLLDDLVQTLHD